VGGVVVAGGADGEGDYVEEVEALDFVPALGFCCVLDGVMGGERRIKTYH
jgi:hypothetical protein